ncbi:blr3554 [Bradyrhizobium diazoefficiens USDA 110]|uniref:Blr3554 protein n=1 Tax=Bradyrhizobium diazoefficiens (strain JCM 10833 / BCRC 13528 / IAM 13628 / NBRC 14792 / USDA 110) TaxID=224911 RepID=Q89PC8_BRADU|nr:hypothetical protein CO678_00060 [Bradyrhizobium diazoefficiens]QBP22331.1 hypothetical protein Bdiaspc4_18355 [Bradyrhizobium diazoefficiens]QHP71417.1 hypothetical protein EI171_31600 [Bradyrhizobium sp. LCT2]BAC48819.1 blr3554 [Bradyrhizobium diazoefficiens USDA 110]
MMTYSHASRLPPCTVVKPLKAQRSDTHWSYRGHCSNAFFDFAPSRPNRDPIAATVVSFLDLLESNPASITFLVSEASAEVAGFSVARITVRRVREIQIGAHAAQRNRGIGGALMSWGSSKRLWKFSKRRPTGSSRQ